MKLVLSRQYQDDETKGLLTVFDGIEDVFSCKTLELPWKDNQHNISCIPENKYYCEKHIRPSGAKSFLVKDVPDRTDILIHSGNFAAGDNVSGPKTAIEAINQGKIAALRIQDALSGQP